MAVSVTGKPYLAVGDVVTIRNRKSPFLPIEGKATLAHKLREATLGGLELWDVCFLGEDLWRARWVDPRDLVDGGDRREGGAP